MRVAGGTVIGMLSVAVMLVVSMTVVGSLLT